MLQTPPSITMLLSEDENVNARKKYLVQGYLISELTDGPNKYRVSINCDHSQFIDCLKHLIKIVPERFIAFIGDFSNLEQLEDDYMVVDIINIIDQNENFIKNCTNIQMAFDYLDETTAFQLYVSDCKFFEVFTDNLEFLKNLETSFQLKRLDDMAILTEFPRTMTASTSDVVSDEIQSMINTLYSKRSGKGG